MPISNEVILCKTPITMFTYLVSYSVASIVKPYVNYIFGLVKIIKHVKCVEVIAYLPFTVNVAVLLMFPKTLEASHAYSPAINEAVSINLKLLYIVVLLSAVLITKLSLILPC